MCEYCRDDGKEHTIFESDENHWYTTFLNNGKFYIFHRRRGSWGADGIDVDNCPMCGRKLIEDDMIVSKYERINGKYYVEADAYDEVLHQLKSASDKLSEKEKDYKTVSGLLSQRQMENGGLKERIAELEAVNDNLTNILEHKAGNWKERGFSFKDIVDMQDKIAELERTRGEWSDRAVEWQKKCKELEEQLQNPAETEDIICSMSPIQVAEYLIHHVTNIEEHASFGIKYPAGVMRTFIKTDLEQIAEHLLVYCKHNKENAE